MLDTALFVIGLDSHAPTDMNAYVASLMHNNGLDRLFDKSFGVAVFPNGMAGLFGVCLCLRLYPHLRSPDEMARMSGWLLLACSHFPSPPLLELHSAGSPFIGWFAFADELQRLHTHTPARTQCASSLNPTQLSTRTATALWSETFGTGSCGRSPSATSPRTRAWPSRQRARARLRPRPSLLNCMFRFPFHFLPFSPSPSQPSFRCRAPSLSGLLRTPILTRVLRTLRDTGARRTKSTPRRLCRHPSSSSGSPWTVCFSAFARHSTYSASGFAARDALVILLLALCV